MSDIRSRFKLMPLHGIIMCIAATLSFVSVFIPMFELFVQYVPFRTYSLFTLLLNPRVFTRIRSGSVNLNFQSFAAWAFVITIVVSVAALTLALCYPFYYNSSKKRKIGYFSVFALLVARAVAHVITLSKMVSEEMINENNLTPQRLYVAQSFAGNLMVIVLFIGAAACLYGALNLKMNYKLFAY